MDLVALQAAGLYDPDDPVAPQRAELLQYLTDEGCTVEEMVLAHARGRLFALAGDRQIRPLVGLLSLKEAAATFNVDVEVLIAAWRTLGLPDQGPDAPQLTGEDLASLRTYLDVRASLGEQIAQGIARSIGAAIARITEAESAALRTALEGVIDLGVTHDEVRTARAFGQVAALVPRIGRMLDAVHRQHLEATRTHFEQVTWNDNVTFSIGVGFADLSGFTRLSQQLTLTELSMVLSTFERTATETVHRGGGRVVKFLGDAVMWVAAQPQDLAGIAADLTRHPLAADAGIEVRAGLCFGPVLAQDGDYFGTPVNLASRLVASAHPGQVLTDGSLTDLLDESWLAVAEPPLVLRGFDAPVTPYVVTRA